MQTQAVKLTEWVRPTLQVREVVTATATATRVPEVATATPTPKSLGCTPKDRELAKNLLAKLEVEYNVNVTTQWIEQTAKMFDGFKGCDPTVVEAAKSNFKMGAAILFPEKLELSKQHLERLQNDR